MRFDFYNAPISKAFDPEIILKDFESLEQAKASRLRLENALDEYGPVGRELARRLHKCGMRNCGSAACPVCLRHFRRWWSSTIAEYVGNDPDGWCTVSVVPADLAFPIGELERFDWNQAKDRLRKQFARSPLNNAITFGGFDYVLQRFERRAPKWRPHIYFLTQMGKGHINAALKRHYPRDQDTPKPLVITNQKYTDGDLIKTASYSFKSAFCRRRPTKDSRGNADTSDSALELQQEAELALLLHRQGFLGRVIRHGNSQFLPLLKIR